jgi:hypothetical protein
MDIVLIVIKVAKVIFAGFSREKKLPLVKVVMCCKFCYSDYVSQTGGIALSRYLISRLNKRSLCMK